MITVTEEIRLKPRRIKSSLNKVLLKELIPISELNSFKKNLNKLIIVNQILENKKNGIDTNDLEKQIDQMVYKLYGLTEEEIKIIEEKK